MDSQSTERDDVCVRERCSLRTKYIHDHSQYLDRCRPGCVESRGVIQDRSIPQELLSRAKGLAFLTVIKG